MDLHIDKKVAVLIIIAFLVGGFVGGAIGSMAGREEGRGREGFNKMGQFDNQKDGEVNDDQGGAPNSDEQKAAVAPNTTTNTNTPNTITPPATTQKTQ